MAVDDGHTGFAVPTRFEGDRMTGLDRLIILQALTASGAAATTAGSDWLSGHLIPHDRAGPLPVEPPGPTLPVRATRARWTAMQFRFFALAAVATLAACAADPKIAADTSKTSYHALAKPVLDRRCVSCHSAGGIAPFRLDDYASAKASLSASLASITAGRMPPWMPSATCRTYKYERKITAEETAALKTWQAAEMPEGTPADAPKDATTAVDAAKVPTRAPELQLKMAEAYTPNTQSPDDYRCFALGTPMDAEKWIAASDVHPGNKALVHHILIFLAFPETVAQLQLNDSKDAGPGWTCYGGPGVIPTQTVAAWVPGALPMVSADKAGIRLPKGSQLVMQVHYNTPGKVLGPDASNVNIWLHDKQPENLIIVQPFANFGIQIAAGDANAKTSKTFENTSKKPWTIVSAIGHMHQLGKAITLTKLDAAGQETCLLDIPKWDFGWQQSYPFRDNEIVTVAPGEKVRLDCSYDNSAGHQSQAGKAPVNVTWGEGTADEMCLGYLARIEPYAPYDGADPAACTGVPTCASNCSSGTTMCALTCSYMASAGCSKCLIQGMFSCTAQSGCPVQTQAAIDCLQDCQKSGNLAACVPSKCDKPFAALDACSKPLLAAGVCDPQLTSCGAVGLK